MKNIIEAAVLAVLFFSDVAFANTLSCQVSIVTTSGRIVDSSTSAISSKSDAEFFQFTVDPDISSELYEHQNYCLTGPSLKRLRMKRNVCMVVTSGIRIAELPVNSQNQDRYMSLPGKVLTFRVFEESPRARSRRSFSQKAVSTESEVSLPVSTFRGTFNGRGDGFSTLTVTCL